MRAKFDTKVDAQSRSATSASRDMFPTFRMIDANKMGERDHT